MGKNCPCLLSRQRENSILFMLEHYNTHTHTHPSHTHKHGGLCRSGRGGSGQALRGFIQQDIRRFLLTLQREQEQPSRYSLKESRASGASRFRGSLPLPPLAAPSARDDGHSDPPVGPRAAAPARRAGKPFRTAGPSWEAARGDPGCWASGVAGKVRRSLRRQGQSTWGCQRWGREGRSDAKPRGRGKLASRIPRTAASPPPAATRRATRPRSAAHSPGGRGAPLTATSGRACVPPAPSHA